MFIKKIFIYIVITLQILIILNLNKNKINNNFNIKGFIKNTSFFIENNNKKIINNKILKKKLNMIYFGYTHCPDICPKIIEQLINKIRYKKNFYNIILILISIDPNRDNCEITQRYLNKFKINNIYGLTGNNNKIENLANNYRIIYQKYSTKKNFKIKINHSKIIYILNKHQKILYLNL